MNSEYKEFCSRNGLAICSPVSRSLFNGLKEIQDELGISSEILWGCYVRFWRNNKYS